MVPCFQENHLKCWEKWEDIVMPKRSVSSLTTSTITDILRMPACLHMISNSFIIQNDLKGRQNLQSSGNHWACQKVWSDCNWWRTVLPRNRLILWTIGQLRENNYRSCFGRNLPKKSFRKYNQSFTNCWESYEAFSCLCLLHKISSFYFENNRFTRNWIDWRIIILQTSLQKMLLYWTTMYQKRAIWQINSSQQFNQRYSIKIQPRNQGDKKAIKLSDWAFWFCFLPLFKKIVMLNKYKNEEKNCISKKLISRVLKIIVRLSITESICVISFFYWRLYWIDIIWDLMQNAF